MLVREERGQVRAAGGYADTDVKLDAALHAHIQNTRAVDVAEAAAHVDDARFHDQYASKSVLSDMLLYDFFPEKSKGRPLTGVQQPPSRKISRPIAAFFFQIHLLPCACSGIILPVCKGVTS